MRGSGTGGTGEGPAPGIGPWIGPNYIFRLFEVTGLLIVPRLPPPIFMPPIFMLFTAFLLWLRVSPAPRAQKKWLPGSGPQKPSQ